MGIFKKELNFCCLKRKDMPRTINIADNTDTTSEHYSKTTLNYNNYWHEGTTPKARSV